MKKLGLLLTVLSISAGSVFAELTGGWEYAASNEDYAFKVFEVLGAGGKTEYALRLLHVETDEIRHLVLHSIEGLLAIIGYKNVIKTS